MTRVTPLSRRSLILTASLLGMVLRGGAPATAQATAAPLCPDPGIVLVSGDSLAAFRSSIDTTLTFEIDRRSWTWRQHTASVAAGVRGTRPASWRACTGAWVAMDQAAVVVEGARGRVHLRASLEPLLEILRRHEPAPRDRPRRDDP